MSKSTGSSPMLREGVQKFGADTKRLSLADAGDGVEDANFDDLETGYGKVQGTCKRRCRQQN
ncbi:hypothetical protein EDB19DRAFT_1734997 [Suillus lakei]|nr:hypothetical protein EDB19DRAFT_1734997 [Suillus lakei]